MCCTAQVLGASSATTKITITSKAVATTTPERAEGVGGDHADQGRRHQGAQLQGEQHDRQDPVEWVDEP